MPQHNKGEVLLWLWGLVFSLNPTVCDITVWRASRIGEHWIRVHVNTNRWWWICRWCCCGSDVVILCGCRWDGWISDWGWIFVCLWKAGYDCIRVSRCYFCSCCDTGRLWWWGCWSCLCVYLTVCSCYEGCCRGSVMILCLLLLNCCLLSRLYLLLHSLLLYGSELFF